MLLRAEWTANAHPHFEHLLSELEALPANLSGVRLITFCRPSLPTTRIRSPRRYSSRVMLPSTIFSFILISHLSKMKEDDLPMHWLRKVVFPLWPSLLERVGRVFTSRLPNSIFPPNLETIHAANRWSRFRLVRTQPLSQPSRPKCDNDFLLPSPPF